MPFDTSEYIDNLFDLFEDEEINLHTPTEEEIYEEKVKDIANAAKSGLKKANDKVDSTYQNVLNKADEGQKSLKDKEKKIAEDIARKTTPTADSVAKKEGRFANNEDYINYNQKLRQNAAVWEKALKGLGAIAWCVIFWAIPGSITASALKIGVIDNIPLVAKLIQGQLHFQDLSDRGTEVIRQITCIHNELGTAISTISDATTGVVKSAVKGVQGAKNSLGAGIKSLESNFNEGSLKAVISNIKGAAKNYSHLFDVVDKIANGKITKESVDEDIFEESGFDDYPTDLVNILKFNMNESGEEASDILDEFVEKCNFANEHDVDMLYEAFDYVYSL
jgi:hypothetical protein